MNNLKIRIQIDLKRDTKKDQEAKQPSIWTAVSRQWSAVLNNGNYT